MGSFEEMSPADYHKYWKAEKMKDAGAARLKYGNKPVTIDGLFFQSTKEGNYYRELKFRQAKGLIKKFETQVVFKFVVNGVLVTSYRADFVIYENDGRARVIDVKGTATEGLDTFRIKCKLMKAIYKIEVEVFK